MKGIDFKVIDNISAKCVTYYLVSKYGFKVIEPRPTKVTNICANFETKTINFNRKFNNKFKEIFISGNTSLDDSNQVDNAIDNFRLKKKYEGEWIFNENPYLESQIDNSFYRNIIKNSFSKTFNKTEFKDMKITKTENIKINGKSRNVTIVVLNEDKQLKAGYSIRMPKDKKDEELGIKIALGRAKSDRTNLIDMELGKGLDRKFILYAIAEDLFKKIERGIIKIKGVK